MCFFFNLCNFSSTRVRSKHGQLVTWIFSNKEQRNKTRNRETRHCNDTKIKVEIADCMKGFRVDRLLEEVSQNQTRCLRYSFVVQLWIAELWLYCPPPSSPHHSLSQKIFSCQTAVLQLSLNPLCCAPSCLFCCLPTSFIHWSLAFIFSQFIFFV